MEDFDRVEHIKHFAPGPPAEKEPPPPSRKPSAVMATLPFKSRQPPANSKPSIVCVSGAAEYCLHVNTRLSTTKLVQHVPAQPTTPHSTWHQSHLQQRLY